jgi:hypothetical protein
MKKAKFTKSLTVMFDPDSIEKIKQITDKMEISLAEWVRDAVAAALTTNQPKEEQMNDQ